MQRNVVLGILNGTLMRVLDTLAGPSLVLPWFVAQLGGSAVAVGLLLPITAGGWFLPQLLMARSVHSLPQKLPLFRAVSAIRVVLWIIMVIITLVAGATNPTLTLWSFIVLYTLFC
ncbi:MAG TPA: MFS transporter, partial [Anaerolineae bacterium]|nr:MFS transporter [Anaerolineae bacterium]